MAKRYTLDQHLVKFSKRLPKLVAAINAVIYELDVIDDDEAVLINGKPVTNELLALGLLELMEFTRDYRANSMMINH